MSTFYFVVQYLRAAGLTPLQTGLGLLPMSAGISGRLRTSQQLGAAAGLAVVVSVYASPAVPGQFLPRAHAALLTAAGLSGLALLASLPTSPRSRTQQGALRRR